MTTYCSKLELSEIEVVTLSNVLDSYFAMCEQSAASGQPESTPKIEMLKRIQSRLYSGMNLNSMSVYDT